MVLANVNGVGLTMLVLAGLLLFVAGLVIIRDWRGWGNRSYAFTVRLRLPGVGFYRDWGYGTYRALIGGGYLLMGLVFLTVAVVAVAAS